MSSSLTVSSVEPMNLTSSQFREIHEVMRDVWADKESLGEFLQCVHCSKMYSREDVIQDIRGIDSLTVRDLLQQNLVDKFSCSCGGKTRLVYDEEHISKVRERMLKTKKAFLVLVKDDDGKIVGYEDAYIDSFEGIFKREFGYHYSSLGSELLKKKAEARLGARGDEYIVLSNIGLQREFRSFEVIFQVLHEMAKLFEERYDHLPSITEIDKRNPLHKVSMSVGGISLNALDDPDIYACIENKSSDYQTDIIVYPSITKIFREYFGGTLRDYIKKTRRK